MEAIDVLKAQLAAEKEHNKQLLNTVYWSMSFVGGLALLLLGASWFNARAVHDREIKNIKNQLSAEQSEKINEEKEQLTNQLTEILEKDVSAKLTNELGGISRSIESLRSSIKSIGHDLRILEHTSEIRYWKSRDVPANVLMQYRLMLEDVKKTGDEYRISEALAGIQDLLENGAPVDVDEIPEFITATDKLPDHFSVNVQAIRKLLAERRG
jgi:hypothetical protein